MFIWLIIFYICSTLLNSNKTEGQSCLSIVAPIIMSHSVFHQIYLKSTRFQVQQESKIFRIVSSTFFAESVFSPLKYCFHLLLYIKKNIRLCSDVNNDTFAYPSGAYEITPSVVVEFMQLVMP